MGIIQRYTSVRTGSTVIFRHNLREVRFFPLHCGYVGVSLSSMLRELLGYPNDNFGVWPSKGNDEKFLCVLGERGFDIKFIPSESPPISAPGSWKECCVWPHRFFTWPKSPKTNAELGEWLLDELRRRARRTQASAQLNFLFIYKPDDISTFQVRARSLQLNPHEPPSTTVGY